MQSLPVDWGEDTWKELIAYLFKNKHIFTSCDAFQNISVHYPFAVCYCFHIRPVVASIFDDVGFRPFSQSPVGQKRFFQKHGIYIDPAHPFPLETDLQLRTALHHRAARNAHEIAGFLCLGLAVASFSAIQHCSPDQFECYAPVANILVVSAGVGLTGDAVYFLIHSRTHHRLMKQRLALVKNGY